MTLQFVQCTASNFHEARHNAEHCTGVMMDWFKANPLRANPDKFQLIVFEKQKRTITVNGESLANKKCKAAWTAHRP